MMATLIQMTEPGAPLRWLQTDELGAIAVRGEGPPPLLPGARAIAVVPGDAVVLHWTELPLLAPAQAQAAARMLAADVSAAPIGTAHVAIGARQANGTTPLALVDKQRMQDWLAELTAAGIDADHVVPAPLLLPVPDIGVTVFETGGQWLVRGDRLAFAAEPGLARMMIGDALMRSVDEAGWAAGAGLPFAVDLRQGEFARTRRRAMDLRQLRRMAWLAAGISAALVGSEVVGLWRYSLAADRAETALDDAARAVLPRGTVVRDARGQVAARLAQLGGEGSGFAGLAAPLLAAMRERPATALERLRYATDTGLVAVIAAPVAGDRDAIMAALGSAGLDARISDPREEGGRQLSDLTVTRR